MSQMDENQPLKRIPMAEARDFRAEIQELKRSGEIATPEGLARLREILKMLGVNLNATEETASDQMLVRMEPFSDEELWENTPPCFRHLLPPEVIRKFDKG